MSVAVAALCAFATYLLFAGTLSLSEAITGAGLGAFCGASVMLFARISERRFHFSPAHFRPWGRSLRRLPLASLQTGLALVRTLPFTAHEPGRADEAPFRQGSRAAPSERARRATALLAASLAPNSFVVRAEPGRDYVLMHSVERRPPSTNPEWLA